MSDFIPDPPAAGAAGTPASGAASARPDLPPELNPRGYTKPRRRHRRTTRILAWLATLTSLAVLVGSGAMYLAIKKLNGNIVRIEGLPGGPRPDKVSEKDQNFLIVGSDSRAGASDAELKEFGTEMEAGQRSDTMLLVHIPGDGDGAYVLSFPRDLLVQIPGHQNKSKINAAYSEGGAVLAVQTVEALTSVRIDHYLEVNFANFLRMVDALDGIEMCIPKAMHSSDAALNLKAGKQTLKGRNALAYVRARSFDKDSEFQDGSSDIGRIHRQQDFIGAMIRKATSSKMLLRPVQLARFLDRATKGLKTDKGTTFNDLKKLGLRFRNLDPNRVIFASVPIENAAARYRSQSVVLMDELAAEDVFTAIREGSILDDKPKAAASAGPKLTVPPSSIRIRVQNGTTTTGLGRKASDDLRGRGFVIAESAKDAPTKDVAKTVIKYGPTKKDSADTAAAAIPNATTELDETLGSTLTIVLGTDYSGTKPVTVARPKPSSSATAKPPTKTAADDACTQAPTASRQ